MFGNLTILSLHEGHFMLCNKEQFQKFVNTNLLFVILLGVH